MAFSDRYLLAINNRTFIRTCTIAALLAAVAAQAEDPSGLTLPAGYAPTGTTDTASKKQKLHEVRAALANRIITSPDAMGQLFALAIASDPNNAGISGSSSDSDIQFTANALFNAFAVTGNS